MFERSARLGVALLAWFLVTVYMLFEQVPIFHHHLVTLIPPLIALALMGIGKITLDKRVASILVNIATAVALIAVLVAVILNWQEEQLYYRDAQTKNAAFTKQTAQTVADLGNTTMPDQLVITDAEFVVGLADRNTPPSLVDTSFVRVDTGYLTVQQLIDEASQPQVHTILFFTGRLRIQSIADFRTWVIHHFRLVHRYDNGWELWVKER